MPFDRPFAEALVSTVAESGWNATLPPGQLPNPLPLQLSRGDVALNLLIHARNLRPQSSEHSDHNRPPGEWHVQLTFDGDNRYERNRLRFQENFTTVLFGFVPVGDTYLIAAFDPSVHADYSWSTSIQVRKEFLDAAQETGMSFQVRGNAETVFIFRLEHILKYLLLIAEIHRFTDEQINTLLRDPAASEVYESAVLQAVETSQLPLLEARERERAVVEVVRYLRDEAFSRGIKKVYQHCAICGFQYDYVLDAAHIVPVAEGGTDTYDNGLGLCPNCHRMFDQGLILVDETGKIYLHPQRAEEYAAIGLAGSFDNLRKTLREELWFPDDPQYRPSAENLRRTFEVRR